MGNTVLETNTEIGGFVDEINEQKKRLANSIATLVIKKGKGGASADEIVSILRKSQLKDIPQEMLNDIFMRALAVAGASIGGNSAASSKSQNSRPKGKRTGRMSENPFDDMYSDDDDDEDDPYDISFSGARRRW